MPSVKHNAAFPFKLACTLFVIGVGVAEARYARPQLEQVPVERLITNLTKLVETKPDDAKLRFNLARAHAMAFAQRAESLQVRKGNDAAGPWFGYEPSHIPFRITKVDDPKQLKKAKQQLQSAIEQYEAVLTIDPNYLSALLGHAWCLEHSSQNTS